MRSFASGLAIGALVGAGVTWAVIARPWRGAAEAKVAAAPDAGGAADRPAKRKVKRRGKRGGGGEEEVAEAPPPSLSAADREMVFRGPAIQLPTRDVDLGSGEDGRALATGEINDVVASSSQPLLDCIEQARQGALLSGQVKLEMLVGGDGQPSKVRLGAPRWLIAHGLYDCAAAAARRMRFPATGAPTVVDVPYHID